MSKFQSSKDEGPHSKLAQMAGDWEGISRVWFEPDVLADESVITGNISSILDGRFALHRYHTTVDKNAAEGIAIYGYNIAEEKYETAWIDSFHTGTALMFSDGKEEKFSVLGSYAAGPERWGWRTEIDMPDNDTLIITMYNITPQGQEDKGVEVAYKRVTV